MFGGLHFSLPAGPVKPPTDAPPPTPVNFPELCPLDDGSSSTSSTKSGNAGSSELEQPKLLVPFLQTLQRPVEVRGRHLAALGVHVTQDAPLSAVIPDPAVIPDFEKWDTLKLEDVSVPMNEEARKPMDNGQKAPGIVFYLERKKELSIQNQVAFRAVRRMPPITGREVPRLGNSFEFYKHLETMANYWDDPSDPWEPPQKKVAEGVSEDAKDEPTRSVESEPTQTPSNADSSLDPERVTYRGNPGTAMPPDARHNGVAAFLRMVVYEFKCNISAARTEPRLQIREPKLSDKGPAPKCSYFPSGCTFGFRTPTTRVDARTGVVEGPIFALSTRGSTNFTTEMDKAIDLGREVVAALITAQHRAREGKEEKRFGNGQWWCTKQRWGGRQGGPVGKEIEAAEAKTAAALAKNSGAEGEKLDPAASKVQEGPGSGDGSGSDSRKPILPPPSKMRKLPMRKPQMSIYDDYRMVRPPSCTWDKKARYSAIGKVPGSQVDEVFVVSSLYHHVCFIRVTIPTNLLEVLDGALQGEGEEKAWGGVEMIKSKWFDLFVADQRIEAMKHIWSIMSWVMRPIENKDKYRDTDIPAGDMMDVDTGAGDRNEGQCKNQ
ncbi:hypothetical protein MKZ38_007473 [Zalerion maritima]|uniref:Uncharacterized protein n=1 Tax=Zalerion maritima TaxID=339359 RepID=A0AAD5WVW7_9PEZI|nr:hypothetical protein MKZ38_007473 [Zalerion maritima]